MGLQTYWGVYDNHPQLLEIHDTRVEKEINSRLEGRKGNKLTTRGSEKNQTHDSRVGKEPNSTRRLETHDSRVGKQTNHNMRVGNSRLEGWKAKNSQHKGWKLMT